MSKWIDKVWHIHIMEYNSAIKIISTLFQIVKKVEGKTERWQDDRM